MNQILSTNMPIDNNRKTNKQPISISSILKIFSISILVFGIFMIGIGVYTVYKNQSTQQEKNLEPTISIENKTDTAILLKIMHQKNISKVEYGWNENERTVINSNGVKYVEQTINIPSGTNTLHVLVEDEDGNQMPYEKVYERESDINLEVSGDKIKITYDGDKVISYMTYRWDEEEEETIQIDNTSIDEEIDAIKGLHTLTVIVVDEDNNTDTKVQKINGVSKPELVVDIDEQLKHFVIKTSDEELLTKVEFRLNKDDNQKYELNLDGMNLKELEYVLQFELQQGENIIEVKVYNSNNITRETGVRYVKQ